MSSNNDEIDLIELYQAFKQTKLHSNLKRNVSLLLKNIIWVILFAIIGGSAGYFLEKQTVPVYRSEMIINSKHLDNYTCNQIVSSIDTLIEDGNNDELEKIGFDDTISKSLKKLEFIYPEQGPDTLKMSEPFRVAAFSTNTSLFPKIENAIIHFLFNNKASRSNHNSKENLLITEKKLLQEELLSLDSMSNLLKAFIISNKELSKPFDPASLIKETKNVQFRIKEIEVELKDTSNFVILKSFTPRTIPEKTNNYYIIKLAIIGFVLGFLLIKLFRK